MENSKTSMFNDNFSQTVSIFIITWQRIIFINNVWGKLKAFETNGEKTTMNKEGWGWKTLYIYVYVKSCPDMSIFFL